MTTRRSNNYQLHNLMHFITSLLQHCLALIPVPSEIILNQQARQFTPYLSETSNINGHCRIITPRQPDSEEGNLVVVVDRTWQVVRTWTLLRNWWRSVGSQQGLLRELFSFAVSLPVQKNWLYTLDLVVEANVWRFSIWFGCSRMEKVIYWVYDVTSGIGS